MEAPAEIPVAALAAVLAETPAETPAVVLVEIPVAVCSPVRVALAAEPTVEPMVACSRAKAVLVVPAAEPMVLKVEATVAARSSRARVEPVVLTAAVLTAAARVAEKTRTIPL